MSAYMLYPPHAAPSTPSVTSMLPSSQCSTLRGLVSAPVSSSSSMIELTDLPVPIPTLESFSTSCCSSPQATINSAGLMTPLKYIPVKDCWDCPNYRCHVLHPHVYIGLRTIFPPPNEVNVVTVQRFDEQSSPFSNVNRWEVIAKPNMPLKCGRHIYVAQYRCVVLRNFHSSDQDWELFWCLDRISVVWTEIAAPREWCADYIVPEERYTLWQRLTRCFSNYLC